MGTMKRLVVAVAAMAATAACAAPSSSGGGARGSTGSGVGSVPRASSTGSTTPHGGQAAAGPRPQQGGNPGAAARSRFGNFATGGTSQARGQRVSPARASLAAGRSQPSPRVTQLIKEKEDSGPGWVGTGLLVWLLSQHDLSASDKAWIEEQIAAQGKEEDQAPPLLGSVTPTVAFHIEGLRQRYAPDAEAQLTVRAMRGNIQLPVRCTLAGGNFQPEGAALRVKWMPASSGVQLLTCEAGGHQDRRLLRAGSDS